MPDTPPASPGARADDAAAALNVGELTETVDDDHELPSSAGLVRPDDTTLDNSVRPIEGRDSAEDAGIGPVVHGISDADPQELSSDETDADAEAETQPTVLQRAHSTPTLAPEPMTTPLRRTHSGDVAMASVEAPVVATETEPAQRPALISDTSSVESDAASTASVAPTPTPTAPPAKSNSYKNTRHDASLRIFFPTEDLAMKAILSPPTLRGGVTPNNNLTRTHSETQLPGAKPSLAESFLETTSRLFFLRGNTTTTTPATTTTATKESTVEPPKPVASRPSTTSIGIDDDLLKLTNTAAAANPNLPPPPFANMFSCENCHEDIGSLLTQGRHHCRNCGGSFCAACSTKSTIVPFQLYLSKGEQRVCDGCFNRIREFHSQAHTTQITWSGLAPPPAEVLVREFDLPSHETPLTVFNCSYFVDFAPFYGHLFLTREHVCFRGYKTHKIKIAYADLHSLVKPEFYYINALQINTKSGKEKHFFAEFNGLRDLCFLRTDQLVRAFQEGRKKELAQPLSNEVLKQQAMGRRRSYKALAAAAGNGDLASLMAASANGSLDMDDDDDDESDQRSNVAFSEDAMSVGSSASDESAEPVAPDTLLTKMTLLLDCDLRADTQSVFELLWGNDQGRAFLRDHMEKTKDIDIDIEEWQPITSDNAATVAKGFAISKEDDYTMFRNVLSKHPPKTKFPGLPPYAGCCRLQRLRIEKAADGTKWTRFVVSDLLRMSGIPFSDYFEIETRWVFTRDGKNYCHVQAGLIVNFIKSTWFKSQIDSSTRSESKEGLELWAKNALVFLQERAGSTPLRSSLSAPHAAVEAEETVESVRRVSTSADEPPRRVSAAKHLQSFEATTSAIAPPAVSSLDLSRFLTNPQALVQLLTLVVLLYCVVVIRNQQAQLQKLSDMTSVLMTKLQQRANGGVCEQHLVDGAAAALQDFFESQRHK